MGAGTAFAAVSGSSTAAAATLAQTSTKRMLSEGYQQTVASGLVASVGTLAAMIPPSIILVFYAITAEAAALGALVALILVVARGRFTTQKFVAAVAETVKSTAMILAIVMAAHVLGHFLTETRTAPKLVQAIEDSAMPALLVMVLIAAFYVLLGFFMDQVAIIALTVPIVRPVVEELGYDAVWFGIFMILLAEVGMITPPMGLNVFVVSKSSGIPAMVVFRGAFPYVVVMLLMAMVFLLWPGLVMWVPNLMG